MAMFGRGAQRVGRFAPRHASPIYAPLPLSIYNPNPDVDPDAETLSPILDIVTSVNLIGHLSPGYATSNTHFAWEDQSAYANHFTSSGDARPTLLPGWLDGNAGVSFDGVQQQLRRYMFRGLGAGSKPCMIVVGSADSDAAEPAGTVLLAHGQSTTHAGTPVERIYSLAWQRDGTAHTNAHLGATPTRSKASSLAAADSEPHWLMAVASNASDRAETYCDGVLGGTAPAGAVGGIFETCTHAFIGGTLGDAFSDAPNRWFKGVLGEIIIFDGVPTPGEFADLFSTILAPRWPSLSWSFV